jgi:hypothetical protein
MVKKFTEFNKADKKMKFWVTSPWCMLFILNVLELIIADHFTYMIDLQLTKLKLIMAIKH